MISLTNLPLPDPTAKRIREWLRQPECREFMDWVAGQAAEQTALAGNKLVSGEPNDEIEAKSIAEDARKFLNCWDVMNLLRNPDFKLQSVVMKPKPFIDAE